MSAPGDRRSARASQGPPRVDRLLLGGLLIFCCGVGIGAAATLGQAESPLLQLTQLAMGEARPDHALHVSLHWLMRWAGPPLALAWLGLLGVARLNKPKLQARGEARTGAGPRARTAPGSLAFLPGALLVASGCALLVPALLAASSTGPTQAATGLLRFVGSALVLVVLAAFTTAGLVRATRPLPVPPRGENRPALDLARLRQRRIRSPTPGPQDQTQQRPQR